MDSKLLVLASIESKSVLEDWKRIKSAKTGWFTAEDLGKAVQFFIKTVDDAIKLAQEKLAGMPGATKKEFVLAVVGNIYDEVISKALPGYLYFLKPTIKELVINTIVSKAIDFMVEKYNDGVWK